MAAARSCVRALASRLIKSFRESQFPHKSVNLSSIITNIQNKLTDLCGNCLLQNDFISRLASARPQLLAAAIHALYSRGPEVSSHMMYLFVVAYYQLRY